MLGSPLSIRSLLGPKNVSNGSTFGSVSFWVTRLPCGLVLYRWRERGLVGRLAGWLVGRKRKGTFCPARRVTGRHKTAAKNEEWGAVVGRREEETSTRCSKRSEIWRPNAHSSNLLQNHPYQLGDISDAGRNRIVRNFREGDCRTTTATTAL